MLSTDATILEHSFKRMTKGAVTNVVQKSREDRHLRPRKIRPLPFALQLASNDLHQLTCCMEDPERMGEACVSRARVNEFGNAELTDSPQALKFGGVEQTPRQLVKRLIGAELDQPVHRVSYLLIAVVWHGKIGSERINDGPA